MTNILKIYVLSFLLIILNYGCKKKNENIDFYLNSLTLKTNNVNNLPKQNLYIKVIQIQNSNQIILATTNSYPSYFTLPVKFGLEKSIEMNFYKNTYVVSLYGDSSGCLSTNSINIKDYKILYPLDMDTENNGATIVLSGTWR
ncbi:MAG: hypothetical protein LCH32_03980 [Bacteroidetes bacterium]|nr:hypothetical protein [Bacteroidota bacterium]